MRTFCSVHPTVGTVLSEEDGMLMMQPELGITLRPGTIVNVGGSNRQACVLFERNGLAFAHLLDPATSKPFFLFFLLPNL
jgi:hypothetical protein